MGLLTETRIFNNAERITEGWYWAMRADQLRRGHARALNFLGRFLEEENTPPEFRQRARVVSVEHAAQAALFDDAEKMLSAYAHAEPRVSTDLYRMHVLLADAFGQGEGGAVRGRRWLSVRCE